MNQTFAERITSDPGLALMGCFVWVPLGALVFYLLNWTIMGDIDFVYGFLGITCAVVVGVLTTFPPVPGLSPVFLFASIATTVFLPFLRVAMDRRAMVSIDVEQMRKAYESLAMKPENLGARLKVARIAYQRGAADHAIAIAEDALKGMPTNLFRDEHRMVQQWKLSASPGPSRKAITCAACGHRNLPGKMHCGRCGAPFLLDYAQGKWVSGVYVRRMMAGWIAAILVLVGIPTLAATLPPLLAIPVIVVLIGIGVAMLMAAYREQD